MSRRPAVARARPAQAPGSAAAQSRIRPSSTADAEPTSTTESTGVPDLRAAVTIASADGAS